MAKIGVVTFAHTTDNYGQVLQFLATKIFLEKNGHTVSLVLLQDRLYKRIINKVKHLFLRKFYTFNLSKDDRLKEEIFEKWTAISVRNELENPRFFNKFRKDFFNIDRGTKRTILNHDYQAFCVGSDQTWSNNSDLFLLRWVPSHYIKFSLAPSVGHKKFSDKEISSFRMALNEFSYITVREDNGLELCKKANHPEAQKILDPTFLVDSSVYVNYSKQIIVKHPTIFIYMLGGEIAYSVIELIKYYKEKGYDIKYVESQGRNEKIESIHASIDEWLGLISSSDYVITNSFHGMAFAIIFRKPFLVFPLCGIMESMNGRINNLCSTMNFKDRIFSGSLDSLFDTIDWNTAEKCIKNNRQSVTENINKLFVHY